MTQAHASPGVRTPGTINWRNLLTWISVGILVGTEVFGALFAGAWAAGGLLELPATFQWVLYGLALLASIAVMVPFMRRAAQVDPLFAGEAQP